MKNQQESIRLKLYDDPELGAGNFFFKAHAAYADIKINFLFLEKSFISPIGTRYTSLSLSNLYTIIQELAAWYTHHKVEEGAMVCLYLGEGIKSFLHFLALNSLGCTPVLINGNLRPEIAKAYTSINRFTYFVYDEETQARWGIENQFEGLTTLNAAFISEEKPAPQATLGDNWPSSRKANDIIMICHSSGTTGIPKAVIFTHEQFFTGKRERLQSFVEQDNEKMVTAMPTTHAAGISYLMTAVLLQIPTLSLNTLTGLSAAKRIAEYQPSIMTGFPQTYASFAKLNLEAGYFSSIKRFYNTADSAHEAHIKAMLRMAPEASFTDMFGASELGMSQFFKVSRPNAIASTRTVGKPAPYAECAILSPSGKQLSDGQPGYFGVLSPTVTPGYYGQSHLTELTRLNSYWLTGDIGFRKANGEFVHLDRIVDVVNTFIGKKAYTLLLEEHLLKIADVFDVTVVGINRGPTNEQAVVAMVQGKGVQGKEVQEKEAQGKQGVSQLQASTLLKHLLATYPFQGHGHELPPYSLCVAVMSSKYELPTGSTGKVLKRTIRDTFWGLQREYDEGDRSKLSELVWNHQADLSAVKPEQPRELAELVG